MKAEPDGAPMPTHGVGRGCRSSKANEDRAAHDAYQRQLAEEMVEAGKIQGLSETDNCASDLSAPNVRGTRTQLGSK